MNLIRQYYDTNAVSKHEKKRAIIACEECHKENDVRFGYWLDCVKKDRKYCKVCSEHKRTEKLMTIQNQNRPPSSCLRIKYVDNKPRGLFKCSECGSERWRNHGTKPYTQLCRKCQAKVTGKKREQHEVRHDTRLARIFRNMKARCYDKNYDSYRYYGAKGITICKEWLDDRTKFYDWALVNGYTDDKQIDKDKLCMEQHIEPPIYSPSTCLWMTREENDKHRHPQTNTGYHGISKYSNDSWRVRVTHQYPNAKDGYYSTFYDAIEARGQKS